MSKEKINKVVPRFRFPEFEDNGSWQEKQLFEILDYERPDFYIVSDTNYQKSGIPVLTANKSFILGYTNEDQGIYEKLPVIIFDDFTVDKKYVDFQFKVKSSAIKILRSKGENNLKFTYELISFLKFEAKEHKRYYISVYQNLIVLVPKYKEQQKIASCLSSLDDLITAQSQKLEALKEHKKGLMQQVFPTEGKTVPKLRFPEFRDSGEWEEYQLGEVTSYFKGFAFESKDYTSSGIRIIRVSDMGFDYIKKEDKAIYINEENADKYDRWKLKELDLIVTTVGSKPPVYDSLVGRTIVVQSKDEGLLLNQNAVCLRANKNIEQSFLNALFKKDGYINFIESIIRGNANQGSITLENLFQFKLLVPSSKEQQKIASCLSSLDDLIAAQAEKIEALKEHKKGLMQGLFPSFNNIDND